MNDRGAPSEPQESVNSALRSRGLAIALFDHEKATMPSVIKELHWPDIIELHAKHVTRTSKSGPMLGGYRLEGSRDNESVRYRSLIQLDIQLIRPNIDQYEWVATSTYGHEPGIGAIKYRLVMLPDRDIMRDEHQPLFEALDEALAGCLDRAAKAWSQAFYLPACPPETITDAFVIRNHGLPLPVDAFVTRGRQILASRNRIAGQTGRNVDLGRTPLVESAQNIARVESLLTKIPASVDRTTWRDVVWAVCSLGWSCGEGLARSWSQTCPEKWQNGKEFSKIWSSYDPWRPGGVGFGTLEHVARVHGHAGSATSNVQSDGKGADVANGKLFARLFRDKLLHIHETGNWLQFDDVAGWLSANPRQEEQAAKEAIQRLRDEAAQQLKDGVEPEKVRKLLSHIEYTSRAPNLRAMIDMAKSEPGMVVRLAEFDSDPMLLGVVNGVLDLRTSQLRPPSPSLLVSKRSNIAYEPSATCPRFEMFMAEIQPEPEVRDFLQRLAGYCLTGTTSIQAFVFLFGSGANGKSVFVETMAWLLGDYAQKIATEMLMQHQRNPQGPSPDIVALKGVRLAYASETEEGQRFASARIKELTGGDTLSGRVPYGRAAVSFQPTHTLVIVGNHKPEISDMSDGMWRRVRLVGFGKTIAPEQRDSHLLEKLKSEGAGILNWMLAGLRRFDKVGLSVPDIVRRATDEYRGDMDIIADWIGERCDAGPHCSARKTDIYRDYSTWAESNGYKPLGQSRLTRRLNDRGYKLQQDKRTVHGITLKR